MAGRRKPKAKQAFEDNIHDAHTLVALTRSLSNRRIRRMRRELREKVGTALGLSRKRWDQLDCVESKDLFVVFRPGARMSRDDFADSALRPLLRQALVAGCTAVETYVADRVLERLGRALRQNPRPGRLLGVQMTVGDWLQIDAAYKRKVWGLRQILEEHIREIASPAPSAIGKLFSMVGEEKLWHRVDNHRKVAKGSSERTLEGIYQRRNKIAHTGDRVGRQRATIKVTEVEVALAQMESIVGALDAVVGKK
jgi:hypothetical protein